MNKHAVSFIVWWLIVVLAVFLALLAQAGMVHAATTSISVSCVDYEAVPPNYYLSMSTDEDVYVEFYEQWGNALAFGDWLLAGGDEWGFIALDVDSGVRLRTLDIDGNVTASITVDGNDHSFPQCGEDGWRPGAPSVPIIDPPSDCFWLMVKNEDYDNNPETVSWSIVADEDHPDGILFHYGDSLIANPINGQSTDPTDYEPVETPCF